MLFMQIIVIIMNMVLETDDLDPRSKIGANFIQTLRFTPIFIKFGTHKK